MASTYVNNLRLNEMATGDGSGTWGTTTNTNLELIAEAFSYGSEAIADASTHTITIADGTSDEERSLYLKCTGGGQACTVTLAPNTVSKVWIIENATSYTLTFTQGSGANVAVSAGEVKMIATDGQGSGAVVYDLLTDVSLAGTTSVVDLKTSSSLTPSASDGAALGSASLEWSDLFLADGAVINLGDDQDTTLTHVADTGLLLNSTRQLQFGDSGTYIHQSADGVLDLVSDTEIEINATTIDMNGTVDISGTVTATGTSVFASLDISGDIDVDGTTNLDVVDIDGAVDMASTLQVDGNATFGGNLTLDTGDITISNAGPTLYLTDTDNNPDWQIKNGNGSLRFIDATNTVDVLTLTASATDIIGELHVTDTSNPSSPGGSVIIEGQRDGTANLLELRARDNSSSSSALPNGQGGIIRMNGFEGTDFEEMAFIGYQAEATVADGDAPSRLIFGTTTDGSGLVSEKMRLDNAGRLGINTTSPSYKLHITGASDGINISGSSAFVRWNSGDMQIRNAGSYGMAFDTWTGSALTEKMRIMSDGRVGIGTTSPTSGQVLTVSGAATVLGTMTCTTISKISGSFKIDHPLKPKTHSLVHSFVESPQADNTYSGKLRLTKGQAELNLDEYFGMTEGTIVALNRDFRVFTTNESNWDNVKGSVKNNILYIESNNPESMAEVSWLVIGERQDKEIHESELTNDEGKIILEPSK